MSNCPSSPGTETVDVKNPLAVSLSHIGFEVKQFCLPRGYADLFDISAKLHASIVQMIELRRVFASAVKTGESLESTADRLQITRNAIYHRVKSVGCTIEDLRDPAAHLDALLNPNAVVADRLDEMKASCIAHDFPMKDEWPQIERVREHKTKMPRIIATAEKEFTL